MEECGAAVDHQETDVAIEADDVHAVATRRHSSQELIERRAAEARYALLRHEAEHDVLRRLPGQARSVDLETGMRQRGGDEVAAGDRSAARRARRARQGPGRPDPG